MNKKDCLIDLDLLRKIPFNDGFNFHCVDGSCVKGASFIACIGLDRFSQMDEFRASASTGSWLAALNRSNRGTYAARLYAILSNFEARLQFKVISLSGRERLKKELIKELRQLGYAKT